MSEETKVTLQTGLEQGLTEEEFNKACSILGRTPNFTELGVFALMWSEHCSYKSSKYHLKKFPIEGKAVVQGPGENAGVIDIGDGLVAVFKVESHNHPSYVEPYQGAATGVGGILRDVFTMGARPTANLNSLRFGEPGHKKTPHLVKGVVAGIGGYGNCMGIPTVGGEVFFDKSYNGNILVNAFTLGVCGKDEIFKAVASGVGNKVIYAGSRTGRDGIHGAGLLASKAFKEDAEEKRPTVQVGDPFQEKKLLEACLEVMQKKLIVGIQDMGAAGLSSSSLEMAGRAGTGIIMHLDRVPTREAGMTPYELMLSESQERMLIVAEPHMVDKVREVFEKWDLNAVEVGEVTADGLLKLYMHGELVAEMPAAPLSEEAPVYRRPYSRPSWQSGLTNLDLDKVPQPEDFNEIFRKMISSANLCSREWVYNQYDSTVGTDTVFEPGYDAALMRVKGHEMGIAISSDCNSRYCYLDPRTGGKLAIIESARNVACTGARPIAFTNCLNFGNPEKPEIMWQFVEAVEGISEAARALDTPVVSGNVSFYNETGDSGIKPTPTIVMVGVIEDINKAVGTKFIAQGDKIVLLGATRPELGGSEYLELIHGITAGLPPEVNLDRERNLHNLLIDLSREQVINSAHDVSDGGFAVALAECLLTDPVRLGATAELESDHRPDAVLFGESQGRVVVSVSPDELTNLRKMAVRYGIECEVIGEVDITKTLKIKINSEEIISADMAAIYKLWSSKFAEIAGE